MNSRHFVLNKTTGGTPEEKRRARKDPLPGLYILRRDGRYIGRLEVRPNLTPEWIMHESGPCLDTLRRLERELGLSLPPGRRAPWTRRPSTKGKRKCKTQGTTSYLASG